MAEAMSARERVKRVMAFEAADRIPRYDIFLPGFQDNFHKIPGNEQADVYDYFAGVDIGAILADQDGPFIEEARLISLRGNEKIELDSWGRTLLTHTDGFFEKSLCSAISKKVDLDKISFDPKLHLRNLSKGSWFERIEKRFCPVSGVMGLFMGSWRLRGEAELLEDMGEDPEFVEELVERMEPFVREVGRHAAKRSGTEDTAIWVYDEFSSRLGPMFSPRMFERYFLDAYRRIFASWREAGIKNIILHCDGNSLPLFDQLIAAGFTGIQSMAPTAGMYLPEVKKRVGNKLVLIGGMDNIETLTHGTRAEIERQTCEVFEAAQDGGVILGTHSIDDDIPVDHYKWYDRMLDVLEQKKVANGEA